jgi:hypothetical protein
MFAVVIECRQRSDGLLVLGINRELGKTGKARGRKPLGGYPAAGAGAGGGASGGGSPEAGWGAG